MNKTFSELYNDTVAAPSPRMVFIKKVMAATGCSYDAIVSWAWGRKNPSLKHKQEIAAALGMEVDVLFPPESLENKK